MHLPEDKKETSTPPETQGPHPAASPDKQQPKEARRDDLDLVLYLRVLLAGWWMIIPVMLIGGVIGYVVLINTPPIYRATCQLEIMLNFKLGTDTDLIGNTYRRRFLQRHIVLLRSNKLNRQVREKLQPKWESKRPPNARALRVTVRPLDQAAETMLRVSVESFDPQYSLEYVQELLKAFNEIRYSEAESVNDTTLLFLKEEQLQFAEKLQEAEDQIAAFESENDLMFEEEVASSHQAQLASLISQRSQIATQRLMLDEQFPFLTNADPATLQEVLSLALQNATTAGDSPKNSSQDGNTQAQSPIVINTSNTLAVPEAKDMSRWRDSEAEIIRREAQYAHMLKTYKPSHPKMIELQNGIEEAKRELSISAELTLKRLKSRRDALKLHEDSLAKAADQLRKSYTPKTASRAQYDRLKNTAKRLSRLHDSIHDRIVDMSSSSVDKTLSRVVEDPSVSHSPVWPVRWKILAVSLAGGGAAGVVLVLLIFVIKSRLYDFDGLERSLGITCLAGVQRLTLTRLKKIRRVPIVVSRERDSTISETFRALRTSVEAALKPTDRILLLTSPEPYEGKTLLSLNTAVVFSWNRKKVLIIDGDFRKLSLRKAIPDAPTTGFTDILANPEITLDQCIVPAPLADVAPNLDYLPAGHKKEDTTELLTLSRVTDVFNEMREKYDMVIIDSAPVNRVVDTIILARQADAILLVARYAKTTVPAMRYCYSRIGSTNKVIGYLLNGIDRSSSRYSYYSSYGYYYGQSRYYYHSYAYKGYYGDKTTDES